jgi:hypothetical protein
MRWVSTAGFLSLKQNLMQILCSLKCAIYAGIKNRRTTATQRYKNARNSRTRPLAFTAVGTLIHSPHLAAAGHTTTGSRVEFKFPELLGSTSYYLLKLYMLPIRFNFHHALCRVFVLNKIALLSYCYIAKYN